MRTNTNHPSNCRCLACELRITLAPSTPAKPARCADHPAYDADYCPLCGTAQVIGGAR